MKKLLIRLAAICAFVLSILYLGLNFYQGNFSVTAWAFIALMVSFLFIFKPEIIDDFSSLITRITGRQNPQTRDDESLSIPKNILEDILKDKQEYQEAFREMVDIAGRKDQDIQVLQQELQKCHKFAIMTAEDKLRYEFSYLDLFYVYNTKRILAWIDHRGNVSKDEFYKQAFFFGIRTDNIRITLEVLMVHFMVDVKDDVICTTPKAKIFLNLINFKYFEPDSFANKLSEFLKVK